MKTAFFPRPLKTVWVVLAFMWAVIMNAQQEFFVSGRVLDSLSRKPLESCSVGFYNDKNQLVTGAVTDAKGYFEVTLSPGRYRMVVDYIGYKKKEISVNITRNNQFLGTFPLSLSATELEEVEIQAQTSSFKVDKEVYTVTKKMKASAANAWDVLDNLQGVSYDRYNNIIKVDGQTQVKILVNGLEKNPQYVQNLNPDRIKKIEIIRDPGGRYGLEGYAAVINIILKQNYTGTDINLINMSVADPDTDNPRFAIPMSMTGLNVNYTYNKINFYADATLFANNFAFPGQNIKTFPDGKQIIQSPPTDAPNLSFRFLRDRFAAGIDYFIDPQHVLSAETGINPLFTEGRNTQNTYYEVQVFETDTLRDRYTFNDQGLSREKSHYQRLFYSATGSNHSKLLMSFQHRFTSSDKENIFMKNDQFLYALHRLSRNHHWRFDADYTFSLTDKVTLQGGYGFTARHERQIAENPISAHASPQSASEFAYIEHRHKFFGYAVYRPAPKWTLKTGLATEISMPRAMGMRTVYHIYQPYADIQYRFSPMINAVFKYRSESIYPDLSQTNPQEIYLDPYAVSKGNPRLKPAVIHKISLRTNIMGGAVYAEPYWHFSTNYIGQTGRLRPDGIFEYSYDNLARYRHYGIRGNLMLPLSKGIIWQTDFDFYRSSVLHNDRTHAFNDFSLNSNLLYMNKSNGLTLGFLYQRALNKHITALGYRKWQNDFTALLFQKPYLNKKLNIMLMYVLPLETGVSYEQETYVRVNGYESLTVNDLHLLQNMVVFRLNYRFHKGKTTRKAEKKPVEEKPKKPSKGLF